MRIPSFAFSRTPQIYFGPGEFKCIAEILRRHQATKVLLITGALSFRSSANWNLLLQLLDKHSIEIFDYALSGEPSPDHVDSVVSDFSDRSIDFVVAIGGGSVIDLGKAISAMLPLNTSVIDYLEGVGTKTHSGTKIPFIAVPTTAGTGSEATKNAVLSKIGTNGFKKSLRHDNFMPDFAIIDPKLTLSCPPATTAACGLDALTQLLESYVSTGSTPITDALADSGLTYIRKTFLAAVTSGADNIAIRSGMAYAALISGITLANAGLGTVHGLASPIGGYFEIPHGVFCGTMIGAATEMNIDKLRYGHNSKSSVHLKKYADVGYLFANSAGDDVEQGCRLLTKTLSAWIDQLNLPRLRHFGISESSLPKIATAGSNKNNPVELTKDDIIELLRKRL